MNSGLPNIFDLLRECWKGNHDPSGLDLERRPSSVNTSSFTCLATARRDKVATGLANRYNLPLAGDANGLDP